MISMAKFAQLKMVGSNTLITQRVIKKIFLFKIFVKERS